MSVEEIYNFIRIDERLITGGHPTADQLRDIANDGFATVINLATYSQGHSLEEEDKIIEALGMDYIAIPVDWGNPTDADFAAFEETMKQQSGEKLLIHCAANYRVTAFYSLYAQKHLGWPAEQAAAFRFQIWALDRYPVWDAFIDRKTAEIAQNLP